MPVFYFNLHDGAHVALDDEGSEFDNLLIAIDQAQISARHLGAADIKAGRKCGVDRIAIINENGEEIASIRTADVLGPLLPN